MANDILVLADHLKGQLSDATFELIGKARELAGATGQGGGSPAVESVAPSGLDALATTFLSLVEPEAGDVDITAAEALVSVGRGIGSQDNVELVQELADAMGAPLSASRPITDLG